jgi:hypothetical protein
VIRPLLGLEQLREALLVEEVLTGCDDEVALAPEVAELHQPRHANGVILLDELQLAPLTHIELFVHLLLFDQELVIELLLLLLELVKYLRELEFLLLLEVRVLLIL